MMKAFYEAFSAGITYILFISLVFKDFDPNAVSWERPFSIQSNGYLKPESPIPVEVCEAAPEVKEICCYFLRTCVVLEAARK